MSTSLVNAHMALIFLVVVVSSMLLVIVTSRPTEQERVRLWHDNGNTWPPTWQEESEKRKAFMHQRDLELQQIPGSLERWENYMQYTQSRMVPHFTERGFDVIQIPTSIYKKLLDAVLPQLENFDDLPEEHEVEAIYHTPGLQPKFVNIGNVANEVHKELLPLHEAWAGGMKLVPTSAYGVRFYQNGSSLVMHYDKVHTHVISSIVHIIRDEDSENWPIEIEDHDGELHSHELEPGQMLFYESAACLHGRMKEFKGKYYGSIFLHYMPVEKSLWGFDVEQVIANVPPHWNKGVVEEKGSRWAGQALTIDSRIADGAPPRIVKRNVG